MITNVGYLFQNAGLDHSSGSDDEDSAIGSPVLGKVEISINTVK